VLDVLQAEQIPQAAVRVGEYLRGRLRELASRTELIGEVRGFGLIAGIDLEGEFPRRVLDGLVSRGVLAGLTGPRGTVLKVRPPLIWREEHADRFVDALAAAL
jgi:4-aminobutyrate aminotransferase-like enzyme